MFRAMLFSGTFRRLAPACAAALGALALIAPPASAATTCQYEAPSKTVVVEMSANQDVAMVEVGAGEKILVLGGTVPCPTEPTLATTDVVEILDTSTSGATVTSILNPAKFAEAGGAAIKYSPGGGFDTLQLVGGGGGDLIRVGAQGVDSDGSGTKDIEFVSMPTQIWLNGGNGQDLLSAQGGVGIGGPVTNALFTINGEGQNDTLEGGEGPDFIGGGGGSDAIRGFGGADLITPDDSPSTAGDDHIDGGAGIDLLAFSGTSGGVEANLSTHLVTGQGTDTVEGVENVAGTQYADTLRGDSAANELRGSGGDDTIEGRGGEDVLDGGAGTDTVAYGEAPSGVSLDLGAQTVSGGDAPDAISGFENAIGSQFADTLVGGPGLNVISGLGGDDRIEARDEAPDTVSCGAGLDTAVVDPLTVDAVSPDCERVDTPGQPGPAPGGGGGGGGGATDTRVVLRLAVAHRQRLLRKRVLLVGAGCAGEPCTIVVRARDGKLKLKPVRRRVAAGKVGSFRLRLRQRQLVALAAALAAGKHPRFHVTAVARDAAGNVARHSIVVVVKR